MARKLIPQLTGKRRIRTREIPYIPVAAEYNGVVDELNRHLNSEELYANGANVTLDLSEALSFKVTLATTGVQFNVINGRENDTLLLQITNGAAYTATLPSEFHFPGGTAQTITASTGAIDLVSAYFNGTNYLCSIIQDVKITI